MRIDDEIQSTKFEDNYQKAAINIAYTAGWLSNNFRCHFDKHNLTQQQFNILGLFGFSVVPGAIEALIFTTIASLKVVFFS